MFVGYIGTKKLRMQEHDFFRGFQGVFVPAPIMPTGDSPTWQGITPVTHNFFFGMHETTRRAPLRGLGDNVPLARHERRKAERL
jgi:hypothetical protein